MLVGINLLREGLDIPEIALVAILDADKEGFLRSTRSLIQTIGRAARNVSGEVHMYADNITPSMEAAINETERRREKQIAYNTFHGIDPKPLRKKIADVTDMLVREEVDTRTLLDGGYRKEKSASARSKPDALSLAGVAQADLEELIEDLTKQMMVAAENLQFEVAARLRDELQDLKKELRQMRAAN